MSDAEKSANELRAKAAFAVAKHALDDALLSDEDRAKRDALARRKRSKRFAQVVIGSLLVVGLVGLVLHYWYWALLLGFIGAAGLYVRHRWRARRAARETKKEKKKPEVAATREAPALKARIAPEPRVADEVLEASVDDDLAELKARLKR